MLNSLNRLDFCQRSEAFEVLGSLIHIKKKRGRKRKHQQSVLKVENYRQKIRMQTERCNCVFPRLFIFLLLYLIEQNNNKETYEDASR